MTGTVREATTGTKGGSIKPGAQFFNLPGDHIQRYVWVGDFVKGKRVLDAGCGHGYGSKYLLGSGAAYVLGLDSDPKAIKFAVSSYGSSNCEFKVIDITSLNASYGVFETVISFEVIEHLSAVSNYLAGIRSVLTKGGLYILSTPNKHYTISSYKNGASPNPFHVKEYYPYELREILEKYFSIEAWFVQYNKTLSDSEVEDRRKYDDYVSNFFIPEYLRRKVPSSMKSFWLRFKGLPNINPLAEKWQNFEIMKVGNIDQINVRFPVQLVVCKK